MLCLHFLNQFVVDTYVPSLEVFCLAFLLLLGFALIFLWMEYSILIVSGTILLSSGKAVLRLASFWHQCFIYDHSVEIPSDCLSTAVWHASLIVIASFGSMISHRKTSHIWGPTRSHSCPVLHHSLNHGLAWSSASWRIRYLSSVRDTIPHLMTVDSLIYALTLELFLIKSAWVYMLLVISICFFWNWSACCQPLTFVSLHHDFMLCFDLEMLLEEL